MVYTNDQRLLLQKRVEIILSKCLPMEKDKAVSKIIYETGLRKEKAREYLKVLFDNDVITYDEEKDKLLWKQK